MGKRTLHVGTQEHKYSIGTGAVQIWSPKGKKRVVKFAELFGWSEENIAKAIKKRVLMIRPQIIKDFIIQGKGSVPVPNLEILTCTSCGKADKTVFVTYDPFLAEIHSKYRRVIWCDDCVEASAREI